MEAVIAELDETLAKITPDYVTISGSGEPTLHNELGRLIAYVKEKTSAKVAVLTNGSLLSTARGQGRDTCLKRTWSCRLSPPCERRFSGQCVGPTT